MARGDSHQGGRKSNPAANSTLDGAEVNPAPPDWYSSTRVLEYLRSETPTGLRSKFVPFFNSNPAWYLGGPWSRTCAPRGWLLEVTGRQRSFAELSTDVDDGGRGARGGGSSPGARPREGHALGRRNLQFLDSSRVCFDPGRKILHRGQHGECCLQFSGSA